MPNRIVGILALFILIALPGLAAADDIGGSDVMVTPAPAPAPPPVDEGWKFFWEKGRYLPQFEFTGRPGTRELYGFTPDLMIPLAQDERNMVFLDVTGQVFWDDGDDFQEVNVGVGYRRLMGDSSWILGGYAYWDRIFTKFDNTFDQAALGVEALSWNWEGRMNGYIGPETFEFARNGGVSQATLVGRSLVLNSFVEQQTNGFDMEAGYRLPFFGEDGWLSDTRILAGGFWFTAPDLRDIGGPTVRFETRIWDVPFLPEESRVTLGTSYRWDDERGSVVQGQLGVRIPLGRPDPAYRPLNKVERRMMDRPVRDISVVALEGNKTAAEPVRTGTGAVVGEGFFFDHEGNGDGSFDDPLSMADAAATGENTLLIGLAKTGDVEIDDTVFADHGQTWMGGGTRLYVWGTESGQPGIFTAPGIAATIVEGESANPLLQLGRDNTVAGLHWARASTALQLDLNGESSRLDIYNNHFMRIDDDAIDINVNEDSSLSAVIRKNLFEEGDGVDMNEAIDLNAGDSFHIKLQVTDNEFSGMGDAIEVDLDPESSELPSFWHLEMHGNSFVDIDDDAFDMEVDFTGDQKYTHHSRITNNFFLNIGDDDDDDNAIEIDLDYGGGSEPTGELDLHVEIAHNQLIDADQGYFVDVEIDDIPNGDAVFDIHHNEVLDADGGIYFDVDYGPQMNVSIHDNVLRNIDDQEGIEIDFYEMEDETDVHVIRIFNNLLEDVSNDDGIEVGVHYADGDTQIEVSNNVLRDIGNTGDSGDNGIEIDLRYSGFSEESNRVVVNGNEIVGVKGGDGIDVSVYQSTRTDVSINNNVISHVGLGDDDDDDTGQHGIDFYMGYTDDGSTVEISRNQIDYIERSGIDVFLYGLDYVEVDITQNEVSRTVNDGESGIDIGARYVDDSVITVERNEILEAEGYGDDDDDDLSGNGITLELYNSDFNTVSISNNDISRTGEHGIEIDLEYYSQENLITINGNTIQLPDENGIDIWVDDGSEDNTLSIGGNTIATLNYGVEIDSNAGNTYLNSDRNNEVYYYENDPADVDGSFTGYIEVNGYEYP